MDTNFHHVCLSIRDISKSRLFYEQLGFKEIYRWQADDNSASIIHLKLDDVILELLAYAQNADAEEADTLSTKFDVGLKHIGLRVLDVRATYNQMQKNGYQLRDPAVKQGRTGVDYFFVKDPDGIWIEIVQDDRKL